MDRIITDVGQENSKTLSAVIEDGSFWTITDSELLHVFKAEFPTELEHLKQAYSVRLGDWKEEPQSPSRILYPDEDCFDEVNRSFVGVLALRWINDNDYETFTASQPAPVKLSRDSFKWIRGMFDEQGILDSRDYKLYVLITSMITNDLGKSKSFKRLFEETYGENDQNENHDMVLSKAARRGMISAIERLRPRYRDDVKRGIDLGAEFNVGQLAQAENVPASLAPLLRMKGHVEAWNMRWMEQLLDISGAAGHQDHRGAKRFIEPVFRSYRNVFDVAHGIIQGNMSLREGYDLNLERRYKLIVDAGWQPRTHVNVNEPEDRAVMRVFCMGGVADPKSADLFYNTFHGSLITDDVRQQLIADLNEDGRIEKPAIQPTYSPGMCELALSRIFKSPENNDKEKGDETTTMRERVIAAWLNYLARVLREPVKSELLTQGSVTVVERDLRVAIKSIIMSEEFQTRPEILELADLPGDVVANRIVDVEGSCSHN